MCVFTVNIHTRTFTFAELVPLMIYRIDHMKQDFNFIFEAITFLPFEMRLRTQLAQIEL